MNNTRAYRPVRTLIASSLIVSLLGLSACNKNGDSSAAAAASDASAAAAAQPASTPVAYTPPTADQLYQMVAPIALFPDKLVALVLAGATYPDQVTAANNWVMQNPSLKGQPLATAADSQPWDPSVKALTAFPRCCRRWHRTRPGPRRSAAYYNDPTDVMNAIQVMRQRAQTSGHLRSGGQMRVTQVAQAAPTGYTPATDAPVVYAGPAIVPPAQAIEIESAQPDVVYVPSYNPTVVYGEPVSAYPGYVYRPLHTARGSRYCRRDHVRHRHRRRRRDLRAPRLGLACMGHELGAPRPEGPAGMAAGSARPWCTTTPRTCRSRPP